MGSYRRERHIRQKLMDFTTEKKSYWLLWKHGVLYTEYDFKKFSDKFLGGIDENVANNYMLEEDVQKAEKYLMKILHNKKMIELYSIYFEKAKQDTNAFKAFIDFSDKFFADEKESELTALLNGIDVDMSDKDGKD